MNKPKKPETKHQSVRLPVNLIKLLRKISQAEYRSLNAQFQMMLEDWLVERGHMKDSERWKF